MTSNGPVAIPAAVQETQPLLGSQPRQPIQRPQGCRRGPLCRRCLAGSHEDTRKRKYMRRTAFAMICVWLWYLTFGFPCFGFSNWRGCRGPLVPWEGQRRFESGMASTNGLIVSIGKGNIAGDVDIQISSDVKRPTVLLDAKVDEGENSLHTEMEEGNGFLKVRVWADEHTHGHHNKICAEVSLKILFPATMTSFSVLSVKGTVVDIKAGNLDTIQFESIDLSSVVGKIEAESLLVSRLQVFVTEGPITISNVEGPASKHLDMNLKTDVGAIQALAIVHRLVKGFDHHDISLKSQTGSIVLDVQQRNSQHPENYGPLPGSLIVKASSEVGHVETNVAVLDRQALTLSLWSATSTLDATVTDNYIGRIDLASEFGRLAVTELAHSRTVIEYEENTRKKKVAYKFFRNNRHSDINGSIQLNSNIGRANLKFVEAEH